MDFKDLDSVAEILLYDPITNNIIAWQLISEADEVSYILPCSGVVKGKPIGDKVIGIIIEALNADEYIEPLTLFWMDTIDEGETIKQVFVGELDTRYDPSKAKRLFSMCNCGKCENPGSELKTVMIEPGEFINNSYRDLNYSEIFMKLRNCYYKGQKSAKKDASKILDKIMAG